MPIQYTVLGFEPTTFRTQVSSHNHWTKANFKKLFIQPSGVEPMS